MGGDGPSLVKVMMWLFAEWGGECRILSIGTLELRGHSRDGPKLFCFESSIWKLSIKKKKIFGEFTKKTLTIFGIWRVYLFISVVGMGIKIEWPGGWPHKWRHCSAIHSVASALFTFRSLPNRNPPGHDNHNLIGIRIECDVLNNNNIIIIRFQLVSQAQKGFLFLFCCPGCLSRSVK